MILHLKGSVKMNTLLEITQIQLPQPVAIAPQRIHPSTLPGYVQLKVADLASQVQFYQRLLGLQLNWQDATHAGLGADGRDLLRLTQIDHGRRYARVTGLYHFAILFPDRRELARAIARLFARRWPNSPTDHVMTKTTYLDDPEGNTIELYCESPEDSIFMADESGNFIARRADGRPSNGREPLDTDALFAHLAESDRLDQPVPPETRIGHFHLYVADLAETRRFYHELLGFDDMGTAASFRMGMVSAGGYHHHIGFNTWQGQGAPPPPPDALGLAYITFNLPAAGELERLAGVLQQKHLPFERHPEGLFLRDPSQNGLLFTTAELSQRPMVA
jgi:catechol 2,3-dioxygenase